MPFLRKALLLERRTRYGANLVLVSALVIGIAAFVNYLSMNYRYRADISRSGLNSLAQQSRDVLKQLEGPLMIYYFDRRGEVQEAVKRLLDLYKHTSKNVNYEVIDPNLFPARARMFGVKNVGTLILSLEDGSKKRVKVEGASEERITNGIIRVLKKIEQKVYFVQGHGERSFINPEEATSITFARDELMREGFAVEELRLALVDQVPEDTSMLAIFGPQKEFTQGELEILENYFMGGGKALIALDLAMREQGLGRGSQQLAALLKKLGVEVGSNLVIDTSSQMVNQEAQVIPGVAGASLHAIVRDFPRTALKGRTVVNFYFPLTTYFFSSRRKLDTVRVSPLVKTTPTAWAEDSWKEIASGKVRFDENRDHRGELDLAVAVENPKDRQGLRLVLTGTSVFAVNAWLHKMKNRDFLLNSVNWILSQEDFISIRPVAMKDTQLTLDQFWLRIVFLALVIALPISILGTGLWIWLQRQNL